MLLVVSRRQRSNTPLSTDQERLLDDWMTGRLSAADAERAVDLAQHNSFAAERVLERRLVEAANAGPGVPPALSARVLKAAQRPAAAPAKSSWLQWLGFGSLHWSAAGVAFAATLAVAVFGWKAYNESAPTSLSQQRIQLAMVTVDDPQVFSGGSGTSRTRTLQNQDPTLPEGGFRDVSIPTDLLRRVISGTDHAAAVQLVPYLPLASQADREIRLLIDATLAQRLTGEWSTRPELPVRVYDLEDTRSDMIRRSIRIPAGTGTGSLVLLTARP